MKRFSTIALVTLALALPVSAQQGPGSGAGQGQGQGSGSGRTPVATTQQPGQPRAVTGGQAINVRLDLAINDQSSTGQPVKKSITMLLADRASGRVRSSGMVHQPIQRETQVIGMNPMYNVELNVDASVFLLDDNKMSAQITLEYTPGGGAVATPDTLRPSPLNQSVTVILQHGKALIITQAADPLSDRKITVEVTATILR